MKEVNWIIEGNLGTKVRQVVREILSDKAAFIYFAFLNYLLWKILDMAKF